MKISSVLLIALFAFCAGCQSPSVVVVQLSAEQSAVLKATAAKYSSVTKEMSKAQILQTLGEPTASEERTFTWGESITPQNFESLTIEFTPSDTVRKIVRVSKRLHSSRASWQKSVQDDYPP